MKSAINSPDWRRWAQTDITVALKQCARVKLQVQKPLQPESPSLSAAARNAVKFICDVGNTWNNWIKTTASVFLDSRVYQHPLTGQASFNKAPGHYITLYFHFNKLLIFYHYTNCYSLEKRHSAAAHLLCDCTVSSSWELLPPFSCNITTLSYSSLTLKLLAFTKVFEDYVS